MKRFVPGLWTAAALTLAACGGGSGPGGGPPSTGGPTATPTPTPTITPSTTVARGTLVDDPSGTPLSGVTVRLDPWSAYPTPGPTPTPIAVSTTDANGHFVVSAPNGTYLLVIGSDTVNTPPPGWSTPGPSATDTPIPGASGWRATIHDRIVLTGGGTSASPIPLVAPTMPPQPLYTPPAVETSGAYRLATLDALQEAPCILSFNSLRASNGLNAAVADEWSTENARAIAWVGTQPSSAGQTGYFINSGSNAVSGGANCVGGVGTIWGHPSTFKYASISNTQTLWFGGSYIAYNSQHSGFGALVFPIDPRFNVDPNGLFWP